MEEALVFGVLGLLWAAPLIWLIGLRVTGTPIVFRMRRTWRLWIPEPPEVVNERLDAAVSDGRIRRTPTGLFHPGDRTNKWRPPLETTIRSAGQGTLVEVIAEANGLIRLLTAFWALLTWGAMGFLGVGFYSTGLRSARAMLLRELGGTEFEHDEPLPELQFADPTEVGAEARAPLSFRVELAEEGATFRLGPWPIRVDARGIDIDGDRVTWDELETIGLDEEGLRLHTHTFSGMPREDLEWFRDYLLALDARHGSPDEDVRAAKRRAAGLSEIKPP